MIDPVFGGLRNLPDGADADELILVEVEPVEGTILLGRQVVPVPVPGGDVDVALRIRPKPFQMLVNSGSRA